jgi:type II secretory pathway component GspD/PulD (secretin)
MKSHFTKTSMNLVPALLLVALLLSVHPADAQNINNQAGTSAIQPITQQVETGPILDVVPYVLSDGYTINLALIPSVTEFTGYDNPPPIPNVTGNLNVVQLPVILPSFTVRQVVTTVNVWDNQTVVIGGLVSSAVQSTKDKVPMIGDLPLVGRLFQSQSKTAQKKNLMIFVTATIVDPAGNRVHSDDDLPFAQNAIPPQPANAGKVTETVQKTRTPPMVSAPPATSTQSTTAAPAPAPAPANNP